MYQWWRKTKTSGGSVDSSPRADRIKALGILTLSLLGFWSQRNSIMFSFGGYFKKNAFLTEWLCVLCCMRDLKDLCKLQNAIFMWTSHAQDFHKAFFLILMILYPIAFYITCLHSNNGDFIVCIFGTVIILTFVLS